MGDQDDGDNPLRKRPGDYVSPYLQQPRRSLREVEDQQRTGGKPRQPIGRHALAALIDLGLSSDTIAAYLAVEPQQILDLRRAYDLLEPARAAAPPREAYERLSPESMREQARLIEAMGRRDPDPAGELRAIDLAFELSQAAELLERKLAEAEREARTVNALDPTEERTEIAERARRWRQRAEEYRAVADQTQSDSARATYLSIARSYETLADGFERRTAAPGAKPASS